MILDGILLYGYISMGQYIITEEEKVNTDVMDAPAKPVSTSYTFLSPLHKTSAVSGKNWKLDLSPLKILVGPEERPMIFLLLRHLQTAEAYN